MNKVIPIVAGALRIVPRNLEKGLEELEQWENWNHPDYSIAEISQNAENWNWEESWRPEKTCCYSDSSKSPPTNTGVKNLLKFTLVRNKSGQRLFAQNHFL